MRTSPSSWRCSGRSSARAGLTRRRRAGRDRARSTSSARTSSGVTQVLTDPSGRTVSNIRISLTQACNLNCIYCHAEGEKHPEQESLRRADRGGPPRGPVLRDPVGQVHGGRAPDAPDLAQIIRSVPPGMEVSLTTNATMLAERAQELKDAGLNRVNVSLDTQPPSGTRRLREMPSSTRPWPGSTRP